MVRLGAQANQQAGFSARYRRDLILTCLTTALLLTANLSAAASPCATPGQWLTPGTGAAGPQPSMGWQTLASQQVVLLGEQHDQSAHHRWQLNTIAALHSRQADMAIGLEMLPRDAQPALDQWVAGELNERQLLDKTHWYRYWGRDADLYLPIMHFARDHRLPLVALNVTAQQRRELTEPSSEQWSLEQRHGVPVPLPPSAHYRSRLLESFQQHTTEQLSDSVSDAFIRAQLVWDSAMAASLANASHQHPLVIGIVGRGHVEYADGIAHQLAGHGITAVSGLIPLEANEACSAPHELADAVFVTEPHSSPTATPTLGIDLEQETDSLVIAEVAENSPAQYAGLQARDQVLRIAGHEVSEPAEVRAMMDRALPGSLIPVEVLRDGQWRQQLVTLPVTP
ncbi:ChaN family lipoprotein [Halomonas huangheensis]|uniref:PDZ domain-containing protein n=1 Tax=Halomonas huangheensis TaxID=1178482 RepID=W1N1I7_9GAMM|nr:ChaN family lipoprotein [Halomonas huangheensis]ALM52240.1 hypothetical protein AR456_08035 [Halomonas huangheensis]ERL49462.1 hypothetical protein BJB45_06695 [Halomonas huangheensis]